VRNGAHPRRRSKCALECHCIEIRMGCHWTN
jgi:hypothetical protein